MITRDELVEIGRYNKAHGVNGEISATIDCDAEMLTRFTCCVSDIDGIFVPFFIDQARPKSANAVLLTIDGINDEHDASILVNKYIYVLKREYSELARDARTADSYPVDYFIGFNIYRGDRELGTITDIEDSTANVLFKISASNGSRQFLLPAVEDFIVDIDIDNKKLYMDFPEELMHL